MPPQKLYVYHPPASAGYGHILPWLKEVEELISSDVNWDGCDVIAVALTDQLGFNVASEVERIKKNPGPVLFVGKCQRRLYAAFQVKLERTACLYWLERPSCSTDIFAVFEEALDEHNGGEPKISRRELVAFLVLSKLRRRKHFAGRATNKSFLTVEDIPSGGFPNYVERREVLDAVDALKNSGLLEKKLGDGKPKFGLGDMKTIEPILSEKSFACANRKILKWISRGKERVPAADLTKNYDTSPE